MINLSETDREWIKLCKGHLQAKYPFTGKWANTLKPLFNDIYGWHPDDGDNYYQYLNVMFFKLLEIYQIIADDNTNLKNQMRGLFEDVFYKSVSRQDELPVERGIASLCALIQGNRVLNDAGEERYKL